MTPTSIGRIAALVGAVTFPLFAVLLYLTPVWYLGLPLLVVSLLALLVVLTALHLRAREDYGRRGTVLFALTVAGLALLINPYTAILGAALILIAFPWFLARLVRRTQFVKRSDAAPLVAGVIAAGAPRADS